MKTPSRILTLAAAAFIALGSWQSNAALLSFQFTDAVGDTVLTPDLTSMTMTFDNATGSYSIVMGAHPSRPFIGNFRINVNLYNPDRGLVCTSSFFQDTFNDYNLAAPVTTIVLTGTSTSLIGWQAGQRVAASTTPFGNPSCTTLFRMGIIKLPTTPFVEDQLNGFVASNFRIIGLANVAPTVTLSAPLTLECTLPASADGTVTATVGDANGDPLTVVWSVDGVTTQTNIVPSGGPPTSASVSLTGTFAIGLHTVEVEVSDGVNAAVEASTTVTVGDAVPPVINSITASPSVLLPPNHKMMPIRVFVDAWDDCSAVTCKILQIVSSEAPEGLGDGTSAVDTQITGDLTAKVRAERSGLGTGRTYTLLVECRDAAGNIVHGSTTVEVPHDAATN